MMTESSRPPDGITIAILDDRKEQRETLKIGLSPALPEDWKCLICPLQPNMDAYPEWLYAHKVDVLLLDQLLNEQKPDSELPVTYRGDQVIRVIRATMPDFPVVFVTTAPEDENLQTAFGEADGIFERNALLENVEDYLPRIERLAASFVKRHADDLARLGTLAERAAEGVASSDEQKQLKAIQSYLSLAVTDTHADDVLKELEVRLEELKQMEKSLQKRLASE